MMKSKILFIGLLGMFAFTGIAKADAASKVDKKIEKKMEKLIESVQKGCQKELGSYCKDVTPGEGRTLACLYAFEDKLSGQCSYALYDAAAQLQQAIVKVAYVANECSDDLQKFCSDVAPGELRMINCLVNNQKKVSDRCNQAVQDTLPK